jgi:hypothetical protein
MKTQELSQKSKAGKDTGSFVNYMMGNNSSLPEVGKGATILSWTDRHAYEVIKVSDNQMQCTIQRYIPERIDDHGMSESQKYKYEKLSDETIDLAWNRGAWRVVSFEIVYTKEFMATCNHPFAPAKSLSPEQREQVYAGDIRPQNVLPGITRKRKTFAKVNILFGVKEEYYDYSF